MDPPKDNLKNLEKNENFGDSDLTTILSVSHILRTLANDHQNNLVLRENALLRQEIQQIRMELSDLRMENLRLKLGTIGNNEKKEEKINRSSSTSAIQYDENKVDAEGEKVVHEVVEKSLQPDDANKRAFENRMKFVQHKLDLPVTENYAFVEPKIEYPEQQLEIPNTSKTTSPFGTKVHNLRMREVKPETGCIDTSELDSNSSDYQQLERNFKMLLIQNIRMFLSFQEQKVVVSLKMFESIFNCFINDTEFMQQMKAFDVQFSEILSNRFQVLYQNHILVMNNRIHQVEQQRRQKLFEHFRTGMQMENWAQRLEMELSSMKIISELRSVVLKLATKKDRCALLLALQNIENKLKKDY